MKRKVHFPNAKRIRLIKIIFALLVLVLVIFNHFRDYFSSFPLNDTDYDRLTEILFLITFCLIINIDMLFYRNYFLKNGHHFILKINSFWGITLAFKKVDSVTLTDEHLVITKKDNYAHSIPIKNIDDADVKKIYDTLRIRLQARL